MDLKKITSEEKIKAMAYDEIAAKEQAELNLRALNQRLQELRQERAAQPQEEAAAPAQ